MNIYNLVVLNLAQNWFLWRKKHASVLIKKRKTYGFTDSQQSFYDLIDNEIKRIFEIFCSKKYRDSWLIGLICLKNMQKLTF